jgi:hypothetical protein
VTWLLARAKIGGDASNGETAVSSASIHDCLILTTWPEWGAERLLPVRRHVTIRRKARWANREPTSSAFDHARLNQARCFWRAIADSPKVAS